MTSTDSFRQRRRVLFVNWYDHLDPKAGGAELVLWQLATRMSRAGHDVMVLVRRPKGAASREIVDGCKIVRIGSNELLAMFLSILFYAIRLRRRDQVVVEFVNKIPYLIPLFRPGPHIVFQHHFNSDAWVKEFGPFGWLGRLLERWVYRLFYRGRDWAVVSNSTLEELHSLGISPRYTRIVPNGADHLAGTSSPEKFDAPTAIVISRLRKYKSVDVVLRAWQGVEARLPDARLLVVGSGPELAAYEDLIASQRLKHVDLIGHAARDHLEELLTRSWVLLQPSFKEGWGLTVMEAARYSTPSIAADVAGLRDSIVHESTGVLVPYGDIPAWTRACVELLTQKGECERLGRNAREWSERFTWDQTFSEFLEVFEHVTARP